MLRNVKKFNSWRTTGQEYPAIRFIHLYPRYYRLNDLRILTRRSLSKRTPQDMRNVNRTASLDFQTAPIKPVCTPEFSASPASGLSHRFSMLLPKDVPFPSSYPSQHCRWFELGNRDERQVSGVERFSNSQNMSCDSKQERPATKCRVQTSSARYASTATPRL